MKTNDPRPLITHVVFRFDVGGLENGIVNLINGMPQSQWRHAVIALDRVAPSFSAEITSAHDMPMKCVFRASTNPVGVGMGIPQLRFGLTRIASASAIGLPSALTVALPKYDFDPLNNISTGSVMLGGPTCGIIGPMSVCRCIVKPHPWLKCVFANSVSVSNCVTHTIVAPVR